nr:uncharacterized protein LOC128684383 [Cherax quadricarinatus]
MVVVVVGVLGAWVEGHGRLVDPPARSTMWRLGFNTPVHYNDHQLFCGGYSAKLNSLNRGRCGECGDPWDLPRPRPNEAGGTWGTGTISKVYREGQVMTATVHLTANHMGWFEFRLCPNNDPQKYVKQSCLNKNVLHLVDHPGTSATPPSSQVALSVDRYQLKHSQTGLFRIRLQLPAGLTCSQCVVQWHYTTGNNWGFCKDGSNKPGCGPQEVFRGCSDIAVFAHVDATYFQFLNLTTEGDLSKFLKLKDAIDYKDDDKKFNSQLKLDESEFVDPFDASDDEDLLDVSKVVDSDDRPSGDLPGENEVGRPATSSRPLHQLLALHRGPEPTSRPSITFLDDNNPKNLDDSEPRVPSPIQRPEPLVSTSDQVLRNSQHFPEREKATTPKEYVSSDKFRRVIQFEDDEQTSAATPFLPGHNNNDNPHESVINSYSLGLTQSHVDTPQIIPQPQSRQTTDQNHQLNSHSLQSTGQNQQLSRQNHQSISTSGELDSLYLEQAGSERSSVEGSSGTEESNVLPKRMTSLASWEGQAVSVPRVVPILSGATPVMMQNDASASASSSGSVPLTLQVCG